MAGNFHDENNVPGLPEDGIYVRLDADDNWRAEKSFEKADGIVHREGTDWRIEALTANGWGMSVEFKVKDSGSRQEFSTGSRRDADQKSRPDFISPWAIWRVGEHLKKGAQKYGNRNWQKGQPVYRFYASCLRHLIMIGMGDTEEDHWAAIIFNAQAVIHFQELAKRGDPVALEMVNAVEPEFPE